jgi:ATP-dependent RNA circularization protein (DNA/RNA ligase family)
MEYPKIETIFNRDSKFKVIDGEYRLQEFKNIKEWCVTEKIDGTNVRIIYEPIRVVMGLSYEETLYKCVGMQVRFCGRTDEADFHPDLLVYLQKTFTLEKLEKVFNSTGKEYPTVILFVEGYGPKIQSGGNYRKDISVRLFDVFIVDGKNPLGGWWLEPENVDDVAMKLEVLTVPFLGEMTTEAAVDFVKTKSYSIVSLVEGGNPKNLMEGIVARTKPLLFTRRGERLVWKLKWRDFKHGEK